MIIKVVPSDSIRISADERPALLSAPPSASPLQLTTMKVMIGGAATSPPVIMNWPRRTEDGVPVHDDIRPVGGSPLPQLWKKFPSQKESGETWKAMQTALSSSVESAVNTTSPLMVCLTISKLTKKVWVMVAALVRSVGT